MAQCVAPLVPVDSSLSLLTDVDCLFDPSGASVGFSESQKPVEDENDKERAEEEKGHTKQTPSCTSICGRGI